MAVAYRRDSRANALHRRSCRMASRQVGTIVARVMVVGAYAFVAYIIVFY